MGSDVRYDVLIADVILYDWTQLRPSLGDNSRRFAPHHSGNSNFYFYSTHLLAAPLRPPRAHARITSENPRLVYGHPFLMSASNGRF